MKPFKEWNDADVKEFNRHNKKEFGVDAIIPDDAVEAEFDLHDEIIAACIQRGWPYVRSRTDRATGTTVGTPDFIIATHFTDPKLKTLWIECKSKEGKQTTAQRGFQLLLEMNGHAYHLVRSFAQFVAIITPPTEPTQQAHHHHD